MCVRVCQCSFVFSDGLWEEAVSESVGSCFDGPVILQSIHGKWSDVWVMCIFRACYFNERSFDLWLLGPVQS